VFPPVPADTAVALGAFLAARNPALSVWIVYGVTVAGNVGSAAGMYGVARTIGRRLVETRPGRRLITPRALAALERVYQRHHLWGIFTSRFLPGYRAVVPPFAGLARLPAAKALPPLVAASALYYGLVVLVAYELGSNWDAVRRFLGDLGLALGALALAATALLAWLLWRHRRREAADG
jgi:membrane protein DedA with SNARE-associated domain